MRFPYLLLFAAGVPLLASAQSERSMPAAANANASVTPLQYQSVFSDYVTLKEASLSPDKGWIRANRALVGDEVESSTSGKQPTVDASEKAVMPEPVHGKHEHKGAHQ
jgi:hypothetical protein